MGVTTFGAEHFAMNMSASDLEQSQAVQQTHIKRTSTRVAVYQVDVGWGLVMQPIFDAGDLQLVHDLLRRHCRAFSGLTKLNL